MTEDRTALTYWFPKIEAAGLPVPKTIILPMPKGAQDVIWASMDGQDGGDVEAFNAFVWQVHDACDVVGLPAFLRTAHTSDKHQWERTCFISDHAGAGIAQRIYNLAEGSEMMSIAGELPWHTFVVREYLPVIPFGICKRYHGMPICKEFRFFVDDGGVLCHHPYWPRSALEQGGAPADLDYEALCRLDATEEGKLHRLASRAGFACGGRWSVDILETERGWYITDMAEAEKSFHWEGCPTAAARPAP
jgi:hypothetical protein